jgi:hypothetical protein
VLYHSLRQRPLLWYGFLVPLSVTVFEKSEGLVTTVPPIVPITAGFLLLAVFGGGIGLAKRTWRASPTELSLYALVCVIESLLVLHHRNADGWEFVAGRVTFLMVVLATIANGRDSGAVGNALWGITGGVAVISLLTIMQVLRVILFTSSWQGPESRLFGFLQMPVVRTLGIPMTYNRFGVMAAAALATVMVPGVGRGSITQRSAVRAALFFVSGAAVLVSQTRGVYLTMLWAFGLCLLLALGRQRRFGWLSSPGGAWLAAAAFAMVLVLGNLLFTSVAPSWVIDLGYEQSVLNVSRRVELNALGWAAFRDEPLLGIGHGTLPSLRPGITNIHNHFWEHIVSTGLAGGIPYVLFHLLILVGALRLLGSDRSGERAVAIVLVVSISATYVAYQFFMGFFTAEFAMVSGLVLLLRREERYPSAATGQQPSPSRDEGAQRLIAHASSPACCPRGTGEGLDCG